MEQLIFFFALMIENVQKCVGQECEEWIKESSVERNKSEEEIRGT